jgi:hypothetical protein
MSELIAMRCVGVAVSVLVATAASGADLSSVSPPVARADGSSVNRHTPTIPKVWDDAIIASLELPTVEPAYSPKQITADYYYQIPVRPIYRSYPVYRPDREPPGYLESLIQREPEIVWDDRDHRPELQTESDWLKAGEAVFDAPVRFDPRTISSADQEIFLRDPAWYERTGTPATREGVVPSFSYVIREKGKVEIGIFACAMCHSRVMPDGALVKGAQGNFPLDRAGADDTRANPANLPFQVVLERMLYKTPWLRPDPLDGRASVTALEFTAPYDVIPPGVMARHRLRPDQPVQVPDLIGVEGRQYLDRTGLQRHRDIGDLMRYAALNQGADFLAASGDWVPLTELMGGHPLPENPQHAPPGFIDRYSDEQLYALVRYVYALKPPANPHPFDARAERGKQIFAAEGCVKCHDPAQGYTNNKLIAAPGYIVPRDHPERAHVMNRRVGTDGTMTLTTRRGTGFYKVPSLRGVWYRGPFEHNGSIATLEDWFDPRRLDDDYVPTGWKGPPGTTTRAVKGHEFGLDLTDDERDALIAFLRTL